MMANGQDTQLMATIPFFVGFVVLQIVSIILDFQYDIYVFHKNMGVLSKHKTKLEEAKDAIKRWVFGKTEAENLNESFRDFKLNGSPIFTLIRNAIHL